MPLAFITALKKKLEVMSLSIIKAIYDIANTILKTEIISSKVRNETRVSSFSTLIQYRARVLSQSSKAIEKIKDIVNERKKSNYPYLKMI
jgi:hypothetical protein